MDSNQGQEKSLASAAFEEWTLKCMKTRNKRLVDAFLLTYPEYASDVLELVNLWITAFLDAANCFMPALGGEHASDRMLYFMRQWLKVQPTDLSPSHRSSVLQAISTCDTQTVNEFKLFLLQSRGRGGSGIHIASSSSEIHSAHNGGTEEEETPGTLVVQGSSPTDTAQLAPTTPGPSPTSPHHFLDNTKADVLALELTNIEAELFRALTPNEFLQQNWQRTEKAVVAPNITKYINRFNVVSYWVATEILKQGNTKDQTQLIAKFIAIATKMHKRYHNFNGLMEIICGLNMLCVRRLKEAWAQLSSKTMAKWQRMENLMSPSNNFKSYRDLFGSLGEKAPKLPYFALILKDFTFINEGNPKYKMNGKVNKARLRMFLTQIETIKQLQQHCVYYSSGSGSDICESPSDSPSEKKRSHLGSSSDRVRTRSPNSRLTSLRQELRNLMYIDDEEELDKLSSKNRPATSSSSPSVSPKGGDSQEVPSIRTRPRSLSDTDSTEWNWKGDDIIRRLNSDPALSEQHNDDDEDYGDGDDNDKGNKQNGCESEGEGSDRLKDIISLHSSSPTSFKSLKAAGTKFRTMRVKASDPSSSKNRSQSLRFGFDLAAISEDASFDAFPRRKVSITSPVPLRRHKVSKADFSF